MTISLVPAFILRSFDSSFHFSAAKYLHDLSPYLVVLTLGKGKTYSWRLRLYLKERKLIRFLIARGALFDILLCIVNNMSWILRDSMEGRPRKQEHSFKDTQRCKFADWVSQLQKWKRKNEEILPKELNEYIRSEFIVAARKKDSIKHEERIYIE